MGTHDGHVIGATKIVDNGPNNRRFNIVVVAEGYRSSELTQFAGDAERLVAELRATPPFTANMPGINVHRLDVRSTDSGADIPASTGTAAVDKRTAFDARFGAGGLSRLLVVDNALVLNAVNAYVATWHAILVIVNSTTYGGAGGAVGTFSLAPGAHRIALHEMGHSAFGLADEYPYWVGCGAETDHNAEQRLHRHGTQADQQRDAAAVQNDAENVASLPIAAEQKARVAAGQPQWRDLRIHDVVTGRIIGILRRQPLRRQAGRHQCQQQQQRGERHRRAQQLSAQTG